MTDEFPDNVKQFINDYLNSVAELEVLLLLKGEPERKWSAAEVGKALYTTPEISATQLSDLRSRGLLTATEEPDLRYQYQPASDELRALIARLDEVYQQRRVSVITMIYSKPVDNVRTFADAFRLRREK